MLVNGTPLGFFENSMGLQQGDPLSPYLPMLAMEVLSQLLEKAKKGGYLSSFKVKEGW